MSLILCLEDSAGRDTNLEVDPSDDFETFLQKAKSKLGYMPQLADITEGKEVSLTDNIYNFLIDAEMNKGDKDRPPVKEGEEEYTDVEYLTEDEGFAEEKTEKSAPVVKKDLFEGEGQHYSQMEYLEEDSDQSDIIDVEMLDSSLEDDEDSESAPKKRKFNVTELEEQLGEFEHALSDLLNNDAAEPVKSEKKFTKDELLDMLGSSPDRKDGDSRKRLRSREPKEADYYRMTPYDLTMLKRTVSMPSVSLPRLSEEDVERCLSSVEEMEKFLARNPPTYSPPVKPDPNAYSDVSKYLPSNYEDVDNEGIYDYMDDEFIMQTDVNDLLTVRKDRPAYPDNDDILRAVDGINKSSGADKRYPVFTGKRPRGRPRKTDKLFTVNEIKKEKIKEEEEDEDSNYEYLEPAIKTEKDDYEDEDYVPGQNVDWVKTKKSKERYDCRMCGDYFPKMGLAISHALSHRIPGKAVFPCIMCAYAYSTYVELQKHMKQEHRKKKSPKKNAPKPNELSRPRGRPGRKPKYLFNEVKVEIIDNEEVCDVEILEEWLDEEDEPEPEPDQILYYIEEGNKDVIEEYSNIKPEDNYTKQKDNDEYDTAAEEEWLIEDDEDEYKVSEEEEESDDSGDEELNARKKRNQRNKNWKHKCDVCLNTYPSRETLNRHNCGGVKFKLRGTKGAYRCALCGQTFTNRKMLVHHSSFHQVELLEMEQVCSKCTDKKFSSEAELFDHINSEHNVYFICDHPGCDKEFHLRSALRAHSRVHGKKCHQCTVCGKQFYDVHNLKEHKITHLPVKPFQCHICLKFLNRKSRLRMHLLSHESSPTENAVICCKYCKMAFKDAADAEAHVEQSEECCQNILSSIHESEISSDVVTKIEDGVKLDENAKFFIEPDSKVDNIVNETFAKNGIICVPIINSQSINNTISISSTNEEMIDGDMKALLDDMGNVKIILKDDSNHKDIENQISRGNIILSELVEDGSLKSNYEMIPEMGDVIHVNDQGQFVKQDSLGEVDASFFTENRILNSMESVNDSKLDLNDYSQDMNPSEDDIKPEVLQSVTGQKIDSITQRVKVSPEELLNQLDERMKIFVDVLKIKMVFRCEYCEKTFYTKEALTAHRKCHEGLRNPFVCNVCNAAFSTFARCTSHKTTHGYYKSNFDDDKEKSALDVTGYEAFPVIKYFLCQHCNKTFLHWTYLQVHKRHKHGRCTYYFNCKICGEKFTDSWSLNSHRRKSHADVVTVKKSANTSYKCADCGAGFNKRLLLGKHRYDHHGDASMVQSRNKPGPFSCTSCDKMYQTKVGLEGHMRSHNGGVYLCDLCGNGFAHRIGLETHHKRVHLKQIRNPCHDCGQNFFTAGELDSHKRCHTGEKPFPCDYCDMSFRTKGRRNEHHRTHTGERPFPCDICGVAFRRSNAMKNHRLTHTGERRHVCPFCPKLFHVQSNLKNHIKLKHPSECLILEVKGKMEEGGSLESSMEIFSANNAMMSVDGHEDSIKNENDQMLVLEDVIIEDESEGILRQENNTNILEYTYTSDNIAIQGNVMSQDFKSESKIQIQLMDETDSGHSLLYTVDGTAGDTDLRLIGGEVRYALVDDIGEDHKPQYATIDSDQFVKVEVEGQNHIYKLDCT